jgi:hypothetical protein
MLMNLQAGRLAPDHAIPVRSGTTFAVAPVTTAASVPPIVSGQQFFPADVVEHGLDDVRPEPSNLKVAGSNPAGVAAARFGASRLKLVGRVRHSPRERLLHLAPDPMSRTKLAARSGDATAAADCPRVNNAENHDPLPDSRSSRRNGADHRND